MKPNPAINILHNLQSHSIGCALNSFLNVANDWDSLILSGSVCHSFCHRSCPGFWNANIIFSSQIIMYISCFKNLTHETTGADTEKIMTVAQEQGGSGGVAP